MIHHLTTRRLALAGLGGAALAGVAARPAAAQSGGMELTDAQLEYVRQSLEISRFLLETSQAAMDKVSDDAVMEFAGLEIAENEALQAVLTSTGAEIPALEPQHENPLAALQEAGEGGMSPALMYVNAQILGHGEALKTQQAMNKQEPIDMLVAVAKMAEPAIQTHLTMLEDMKIRLTES